jgi:hypothetical protein
VKVSDSGCRPVRPDAIFDPTPLAKVLDLVHFTGRE